MSLMIFKLIQILDNNLKTNGSIEQKAAKRGRDRFWKLIFRRQFTNESVRTNATSLQDIIDWQEGTDERKFRKIEIWRYNSILSRWIKYDFHCNWF